MSMNGKGRKIRGFFKDSVMLEGEKIWAVVIGGDNLSFPSWNRVN